MGGVGPVDRVVAIAAAGTATTVAAVATATAATTIAAAAAATESAAAAAAESTATRTIFFRTGFVDGQCATTEVLAIESLSCFGRILGSVHGDKCEAARASGHFVHRDENVGDVTELSERVAQLVFSGFKGHVSYV